MRFTYENRYFQDHYEGLPLNGYGAWIANMVDHPRITVHTGVDFFDASSPFSKAATVGQVPVVYTGAIDRYFDYEPASSAGVPSTSRPRSWTCPTTRAAPS